MNNKNVGEEMESRTIKFTQKHSLTVGELITVLMRYDREAEVKVSLSEKGNIHEIIGVSDNFDWGNDNEAALLEVRIKESETL